MYASIQRAQLRWTKRMMDFLFYVQHDIKRMHQRARLRWRDIESHMHYSRKCVCVFLLRHVCERPTRTAVLDKANDTFSYFMCNMIRKHIVYQRAQLRRRDIELHMYYSENMCLFFLHHVCEQPTRTAASDKAKACSG